MRFHAPRPHFKIYRRYFNAECRHIERSEISLNLSEKYISVSSSVGFFTIVQNDV